MNNSGGVRLYRTALRCYPRSFRDEYGSDMVALLRDQLADEPAARVWSRLFTDLLISVPTRHLEVHMNRPPSLLLPALFGGLTTAGVLILVIGGAGGATLAMGALLTLVSGTLGFLFWRDTQEIADPSPGSRWWKCLGTGVAALAIFVALTTGSGEVTEAQWPLAMVALVIALALIATGVILGVARLAAGRGQAAR